MSLSVLPQSSPAQTTEYMIAGYVVIIGVMVIYIISIWLRNRNLMRQWEMLEAFQGENE